SKFRVPPLIMGHEFAGEVVALGTEVKQVAVGQRVAVNPNLNCGKCRSCLTGKSNLCQSRKIVGTAMRAGKYDGGMAEYVCVPSRAVLPIPDEVSFDEAALLEPLAVAMHAVKQSEHVKNEVVAVVGVGPIGLLAVQCAKSAGARTVVAVDINEDRLAIARQLRADIAITNTTDYRVAMGNINEVGTATVIDAVGTAESLEHSVQMVRDGGDIVVVGLGGRNLSVDTYELVTREIVIRGSHIYRNEMEEGLAAIASGAINLHALITSVWPLEKGPDVFAELASGQTKDVKVVLHPA
ncbi:MAG TPA: alcohol dehydrogenase catalytic domain-containing protein, partial [Candidatus Latescibacteria bacterium]|nr:alcohol dehydrogenase catalytic domain-containing protein [Candidatus Latescibacterota bacterium]